MLKTLLIPKIFRKQAITFRLGDAFKRSTSSNSIKSDEEKKAKELAEIAENASIDNPPTTCCMSGCANCVFIVWAEALSKKMSTSKPDIAEKILKLVDDPSLKAFLEMELRMRGLK